MFKNNKYLQFIIELAKVAILAAIIVVPIRYFLFQPFIVSGASMSPNFETGDYLIIDEISYRFSEPERGDIIVFNASFIPGYEGQKFIKRVIGLPGETVNIFNGKVEIIKDGNIIILDENYLSEEWQSYYNKKITLQDNQYFVMGDNREHSYDSRMWGALPKDDIIGKAALRLLPLTKISWLK